MSFLLYLFGFMLIMAGVAWALVVAGVAAMYIAIICLIPYNILNARIEQTKQEISDASHALEILIKKSEVNHTA